MRNEDTVANEADQSTYRGLKMHAVPSLHEHCMSVIESIPLVPNARVLDLAAGEGAFTVRLLDAGMSVAAAEREAERFRLDVPCQNIDLNVDFHDRWNDKFDLVVAIEILEHLHNPRHFIRNCLKTLSENGYLLVTSPNVESWLSRVRFLRDGTFLWFEENDYSAYGHLTPIFSWQIRQICTELGAALLQVSNTKNSLLRKRLGESWWKTLRNKATYFSTFYPLMMGRKDGEISIYLIRKGSA